jgi:hypothetical protein
MSKTVRMLLMSALLLLGSGLLLYHYGSELNLEAEQTDPMLWEQTAGDRWLYAGGLMILFSGALSLAAVKVWLGRNRNAGGSSLTGLHEG